MKSFKDVLNRTNTRWAIPTSICMLFFLFSLVLPAIPESVAQTTNQEPTLTSLMVDPATGEMDSMFTFSCVYTDADNDTPTKTVVNIDGMTYSLVRDGTAWTSGVPCSYSTTLGLGTHDVSFSANDGNMGHDLTLSYPGGVEVTEVGQTPGFTIGLILSCLIIGTLGLVLVRRRFN